METDFTLHLFGYGETQINSKEVSFKCKSDLLKKQTALVNAVFANKPTDNQAQIEFHSITFFCYDDVRWISKQDSFALKNDESLKTKIDAVIAELIVLHQASIVVNP